MENNEKLIRADELKEAISSHAGMLDGDGEFWISLQSVLSGIDIAPAVDAVPVVRCNDCKWYMPGIYFPDMKFCWRMKDHAGQSGRYVWPEDGFCSYGERRETDA